MSDKTNDSAATSADDDFLSSLRLDQSYTDAAVGVRKTLKVMVRKPNKSDFFRVHPDHSLDCFAVELKEEREVYFITPALAQLVHDFAEPVRLRLCVTRLGVKFLWPIKLPREERRLDEWRRSAAEAAHLAESTWIRLAADMHLGAYQSHEAINDLGDPEWPTESWPEVVKVALRDRRIDTEDHAVIRQLLGQS